MDTKPLARNLLWVTVGLNVALGTILILLQLGAPHHANEALRHSSPRLPPSETSVATPSVREISPVSRPDGLTWNKLKSANPRDLVRNLRLVKTPEHVIQDLVLNNLEEGAKKPYPFTPHSEFWLAGSQARLARGARENSRLLSEQQTRSLLKELFGFVPDSELKNDLLKDPEILFVFGFIPDPRLEPLLSELKYVLEYNEKRVSSVSKALEGQSAFSAYRDMLRTAATQLGPNEVEEGRLRACMFLVTAFSSGLSSVGLTGQQARELLRTLFLNQDPIEELILRDGNPGKILQMNSLMTAALVSPSQWLKIERLADSELNQAFLFAEKANIPAESALKLYEITSLARAEMEAVSENFLLEQNQIKELSDIKRATREVLKKVIPPQALEAFDADYADLKEVNP